MTSESKLLIDELDRTLSNASESQHSTILRRVTDLFLDHPERFSRDHVAIFDDVMMRLIDKAGSPALNELSGRLATVGNAPANTLARLSGDDDIAVSGPVLEKSSVLTDEILAEIAKTRGPKHLAAIATRTQIGEVVTDILADRGGPDIASRLAGNQGARLSELGFVKLINKAKSDAALAAAIAKRTDVPPELEPFLKLALA
jgi:uncharacterized protein (DUF2336 family)